jgi:cobalt-zinc-cadmium efflux system outer membrane protein
MNQPVCHDRKRWWVAQLACLLIGIAGCTTLLPESTPLPSAAIHPVPEERRALSLVSHNQLRQPTKVDESKTALPAGQEQSKLPAIEVREPGSVSATKGLTLQQVVLKCLKADPRIRAGLEGVAQAHAEQITSALPPNPELFTDIQMLPLRDFSPEKTLGPPQFDFQLSYPIDWWLFGKRAAAMTAAEQGYKGSAAVFANLVRLRTTEAAIAYFDVLESKGLVEVAQQDLDNLERVAQSLQKAIEVGGRPLLELQRIRLDILQSQQVLREARANLSKAKVRLQALLGYAKPDPDFEVVGTLDMPSEIPEPPSVEEAFARAVQYRPDIQALQWKVSQAQAEVAVEDKKAYPEIRPVIGYVHQFQKRAIGQPDAPSFTLALTSGIPWYDRNQGNRLKARSVLAQCQFDYQAELIDLRAEIEQALIDYRLAVQDSQAVTSQQLQLARTVRQSLSTAYNAGGRTLIDFLDAQRNFRETFNLYVTARARYWRATVRLIAAIGTKDLHDVQSSKASESPP